MTQNRKAVHDSIVAAAAAGYRVFPLVPGESGEGKTPAMKAWNAVPYARAELFKAEFLRKNFPGNYGIALDKNVVVVDIDPRNFPEGRNPVKEFGAAFEIADLRKLCGHIVATPGGGLHMYFSKPEDVAVRNDVKRDGKNIYPGIEFKSFGRFMVGPGSTNAKNGRGWTTISGGLDAALTLLPDSVLDAIRRPEEAEALPEELAELAGIEIDAVHNVALAAAWLAGEQGAPEGERDNTAFRLAAGVRDWAISANMCLSMLGEWNEKCSPPLDDESIRRVVRSAYTNARTAAGTRAIDRFFGDDTGAEPSDGEIAALLGGPGGELTGVAGRDAAGLPVTDLDATVPIQLDTVVPDLKRWIYVHGIKRFVRDDGLMFDKEQFDIYYRRIVEGKASVRAWTSSGLVTASWPTYAPGSPRVVFEDGQAMANTWRPGRVTPLVPVESDRAIFEEWLGYLLPDPQERALLTAWLAYTVQKPGDKILWGVLLQGNTGIGKSLIGYLMDKLLGRYNVSRPTNKQIHDKYTGWAANAQLVVIEELMARGRLDMVNELKDKITEPEITVSEKYVPSYRVPNRANYLATTNFKDAIIISEDDRRLGVFFSPAAPASPEFYTRLTEWMDQRPGAALALLLEYDWKAVEAFRPKGRAPMTAAKREAIELTAHPVDAAIADLEADGAFPFGSAVFRLDDAAAALDVDKRVAARHLRGRGYIVERAFCDDKRKTMARYLWRESNGVLAALSVTERARMAEKDREKAGGNSRIDLFGPNN